MHPESGFRLKNSFVILAVAAALGFTPGSFVPVHAQRAGVLRQGHTTQRQRKAPAVTCGSGTNSWTGSAGNNQWTTATNWSSGTVPVSTDNVCIASTFTTAITIGSLAATNQTIASLDSGAPLSLTTGPLTITGTATFAADLNLTGTLTLNGTGSMTTLELSGGVALTNSSTLSVSGLLTWSGGTVSGTGTTNANGGMALSGEPFLSQQTLNNVGTATWDGSTFLMENGAVINNEAGATWNHKNDSEIEYVEGTTPVFSNAGTFEKTGGTSSSGGGFTSQITFTNSGTITAKSGILLLGSLFTQTGGSTVLDGGNISTYGATTMTVTGGSVFGAGTITGGLTNTSGTVSASPSLSSTTTGTLAINGEDVGYYTQGAGGTAEFNLAGTSNYDVLSATGAATLAGSAQLCLVKGFAPKVGSAFPIMTYASETGTFSTVNFGWTLGYGATSITATYNGAQTTSFSPSSLAFPSTLINTASEPLTFTLSNNGGAALSITSVTITGTNKGDFSISSNTCGSSVGMGANCTIGVTFTPAALGSRSASISVVDNACLSPQTIALSGNGTEITMSPSPVNYGNQAVGTPAPMTVTVTNHGTTSVKVTSAKLSGTNKGDFAITSNNCTTIAANGGTCDITITFTPAASGARTATLTLTDSDKGSPQTDVLEGTGTT